MTSSLMAAHSINTAFDDWDVQCWRESPDEVDFMLSGAMTLAAIDVKSGAKYSAPKGLAAFV